MPRASSSKLGNYVYDAAAPDGAGDGKHDHVVIETDAPARIVFNDHRRFGLMTLVQTDRLDDDKLFKDIGIEPLSDGFNTSHLARALEGKKTPIKSALLDQRVVAGLGNIYVCEALFRAHISPKTAGRLDQEGADRAAGDGDQDGAEGRHRRRRLDLARSCPGHRRSRQFPASLPGLWPRRQAVPEHGRNSPTASGNQKNAGDGQTYRPGRSLDLLLSRLPEMSHPETPV